MDIKPGQTVTVEVVRTPPRAASRKTLARVFRKDPQVARQQRWTTRHRPSWQETRRGGRMWHHQMRTTPPVTLASGSRYTVLATLDVIRDLQSVGDCIKVTAK